MKKIASVLLVVGAVLLVVSLSVSGIVKGNENVQMLESMIGRGITPANVESMMDMLSMFGEELDGGTTFGLQIYAKSPILNTLGGVGIAAGVVLFVLDWYQKKNA